tara:strand:- start:7581 stop:7727 length:147 start_codon:yes stop_codon:yes gene_type:complete
MSHKKFGGCCPKQSADTNKDREKINIFKFNIFYKQKIKSINYISKQKY